QRAGVAEVESPLLQRGVSNKPVRLPRNGSPPIPGQSLVGDSLGCGNLAGFFTARYIAALAGGSVETASTAARICSAVRAIRGRSGTPFSPKGLALEARRFVSARIWR